MRQSSTRSGQARVAARPTMISRPGLRKASEENNIKSGLQNLDGIMLKAGEIHKAKAAMTVKSGMVELGKRAMASVGSENGPVTKLAKFLGKKPEVSKCGVKTEEVTKFGAVLQQNKGLRAVSKNSQQTSRAQGPRLSATSKKVDKLAGCAESAVAVQASETCVDIPLKSLVQVPVEEPVPRARVTRSLSRKLQSDPDGNESAGTNSNPSSKTRPNYDATGSDSVHATHANSSVAGAIELMQISSTDNCKNRCSKCSAAIVNQSDSALESGNDASCANGTTSSLVSSKSTTSLSSVRDPLSLTDFVDDIFAYYQLRETRYVSDDYLRQGIARSCITATLQGTPGHNDSGSITQALAGIRSDSHAKPGHVVPVTTQGVRVVQTSLTPFMRAVLIDWLVEIQLTFELTHEPLYIAVRLVDLYLSRSPNSLPVSKLQLLGLICMLIGTKYEERQPPAFADLLELCDNAYNEDDLINMELDVLRMVGYDIGAPLSYRFLRRFANVINESLETLTLARYILEITLMLYEFVVEIDSEMAAASLLLALLIKRVQRPQVMPNDTAASSSPHSDDEAPIWPATLVQASGYNELELYPLLRKLNQAVPAKVYPKLQTVRGKYAQEPFFCVAKNYRQLTEDEVTVFEKAARERNQQQLEAKRRLSAANAEERLRKDALVASRLCTRCASAKTCESSESSEKPVGCPRRSATRASK